MLVAVNWRFIYWLLICALAFVTLSFVLPESLASNILHRRAKRVRQQTGDVRYRTKEQEQSKGHKIHIGALLIEAVWRPIAIIGSEPGVLAFDLHVALLYGSYYLFFEAYSLVFIDIYHFTAVEQGLAYFGFLRGVCSRVWRRVMIFLKLVVKPRLKAGTFQLEHFLILAMWTCPFMPISSLLPDTLVKSDHKNRSALANTGPNAGSEPNLSPHGCSDKTNDDLLTGPSDPAVQSRQRGSFTSDSAPSEARKRGSGGGSRRKYDNLPAGPSDLNV
jgi:hypothetical protein